MQYIHANDGCTEFYNESPYKVFTITASGELNFGNESDIKLYRSGSGTLSTSGNFTVGGNLNCTGDIEADKLSLSNDIELTGFPSFIHFKEPFADEIRWFSEMSALGFPWVVENYTTSYPYAWIDAWDGTMWCEHYDEFSYKLPETRVERITELKTEVEKPHAIRDDKGRIICNVCGKKLITECKDREHIKTNQDTFGHSLGCLSMGAAKLSLEVNDKVDELESQIADLTQKIAELGKNLNS